MSTATVMPIERRTLHEELAVAIRDLIIEGELKPAEKISEKVLCDMFNVSRTPVREALKILAAEGLVQLTPNRGASVSDLTLEELEEIFPVLGALEGLAGELACRNVTDSDIAHLADLQVQMETHHKEDNLADYFRVNQNIHQFIIDIADNASLAQIHRTLSARAKRARFMVNLSKKRWGAAVSEHKKILRALSARDEETVGRLMTTHIANKFDALKATWKSK